VFSKAFFADAEGH
jgi:hypothetical protein